MLITLTSRVEDGVALDVLVFRFDRPALCVSSGPHGGGWGPRHWVINAQVASDYARTDIAAHVGQMTRALALAGEGVALLTAADVRHHRFASDGGVEVDATVGLSRPTWAAGEDEGPVGPGTINVVAYLPVRLGDAALVNAVATATEAKSQALYDAKISATGTASDAVCLICPLEGEGEPFGGPRSTWGSRLARAVHRAVLAGARGNGP